MRPELSIHGKKRGYRTSSTAASRKNTVQAQRMFPELAGLGTAAERAALRMPGKTDQSTVLRDELARKQLKTQATHINGRPAKHHPNNADIIFEHIEEKSILLLLNMKDVFTSAGRQCP